MSSLRDNTLKNNLHYILEGWEMKIQTKAKIKPCIWLSYTLENYIIIINNMKK